MNQAKPLSEGPTPPAAQADFRPLSILVGMAFFMEQLDSTIISPVIPDLARAFDVEPMQLSITMTVYLLCSLAFIPFGGPLAARFGTRTVFQWALLTFTASSLLCAGATTLWQLTAARAVQGISAALMVPVGRTTIVCSVPKGQLVQALAWMITPAMVGPMLGPPLGGIIATWLSWHWVFLINVPVGLAGYWWARTVIPQLHAESPIKVRAQEWLLITTFLLVVIFIAEGARSADRAQWLPYAAGVLILVAITYARYFRRQKHPMLDFGLLQVTSFSTGFWAGALVRVGYGALPFLLPLMLQVGLGYSAMHSGMILLASGVIAFFTKTQTARLLQRWGFRRVLLCNGSICAAALLACAAFATTGSQYLALIGAIACVAGFARSVQFNALTAIAYADLPPTSVASATTLNTMGWQLAIMLGISISSWVIDVSSASGYRDLPNGQDFAMAFVALSVIAFLAIPKYLQLRPDAGAAVSGCKHP